MIGRRRHRRRDLDPDVVLKDARRTLAELRGVLADFRSHLDELEAEVKKAPEE